MAVKGHAANAHKAQDLKNADRSLLLSPKQLRIIRAFCATRIQDLAGADKKSEQIRQEIQENMPEYRQIIQRIDAL